MTDLAAELTAYAKKSNSEWPFVTMPLWEVNAHHARKMSGIEAMGVSHVVKREEKEAWEAYALQNYGWIDESRSLILDKTQENAEYVKASILPFIYQLKNASNPNELPTPVDPDREVRTKTIYAFVLGDVISFCFANNDSSIPHRATCPYGSFHLLRFMDFCAIMTQAPFQNGTPIMVPSRRKGVRRTRTTSDNGV